jgi:dihydrofolate reductase
MRQLRYGVAMSLDGFIAGPNGEYDWIVPDPAIDFAAIWARYDFVLMGRKTYEIARTMKHSFTGSGPRWIVVSSTLKAEDNPEVSIMNGDLGRKISALKAETGKDIWIMGGGVLFRSLLDAGLVDAIDVVVMPVLLGSGVPFLPEGRRQTLSLASSKSLLSGILQLSYEIAPKAAS